MLFTGWCHASGLRILFYTFFCRVIVFWNSANRNLVKFIKLLRAYMNVYHTQPTDSRKKVINMKKQKNYFLKKNQNSREKLDDLKLLSISRTFNDWQLSWDNMKLTIPDKMIWDQPPLTPERIHNSDCWSEDEITIRSRAPIATIPEDSQLRHGPKRGARFGS